MSEGAKLISFIQEWTLDQNEMWEYRDWQIFYIEIKNYLCYNLCYGVKMKAEEKEFKEYEGREQSDSLKIKEVKF